jgi:hypothetical protein
LEDHAELFSEQVDPIQRAVILGDGGQGGALIAGEIGWGFQQCSPGFLDRGGLVGASGAAHLGGESPTDLIKGLGGPGHHVERVMSSSYLEWTTL